MPDGPRTLAYSPEMEDLTKRCGLRTCAREPNLPRAVCLANAAAARLRQAKEHDEAHAAGVRKHGSNLPRHIVKMAGQIRGGLLDQA